MIEYPIIAFTAFLILSYGIFSKISDRSVVSAPMVFVLVGVLASVTDIVLLREGSKAPYVRVLAEATLVVVLFIDASTINLKKLMAEKQLPARLLGIGLPLTMIVGALIAIFMFPEERALVMILMALILSPTDAALGRAVVTSDDVPEKVRQTINVESGLNDGIALPPILVCIALLGEDTTSGFQVSYWLAFVLKQFVYGPAIGALVGWIGGLIIDRASSRGWMNHTYQQLAAISLAILAFSVAESVHGNGFIAAFVAGLALGTRTKEIRDRMREFGEAESQAMILFIFLLFGMLLVPLSLPYWDWRAVVYALLSLTIIRMGPAAISLLGTGLPWSTIWFISWFGPRGIASVLYLLIVVITIGSAGYERMISVITLTVMLSIFLHGITAVPLSRSFRRRHH